MADHKNTLRKEENRRLIISSARKVFATIGYDAASVRDIVRESGLAPGSFYNNFSDKNEIFQEVIEQIGRPVELGMRVMRQEAKTASEFIRGSYELCVMVTFQDAQSADIIGQNQNAFRRRFYIGETSAGIRSDLVADLEEWTSRGIFKEHDCAIMAEAMISLGVDLVVQTSVAPDQADRRIAFLEELFLSILTK